MKRYLFILTIFLTALLFFGVSGGVFAAEDGENAAEETSVNALSEDILGVASTLTYTSPYTNLTYNIPSNVKALGVDVSSWQGEIEWEAVADDGIEFAFIRAAKRGISDGVIFTDSYLTENIEEAQAAGIKVGVYIFSQATNKEEAQEEAQYVIDLISDYNLDLPIVMDVEFGSGHTGRLYDKGLSKSEMTDICLAFCDYLTTRGYMPMVYVNSDILKNYLNPADILAETDFWYANYSTTQYYTLANYTYPIWQYSNAGTVDGIDGSADCNFSFVDLDVLGMPFDDVPEGSWYFNAVLYAYQNHLFSGTSSSTFAPADAMNRAMLVSVLYRIAGSPDVTGSSAFTDVIADSWYEDGVLWAEKIGIVNGITATRFAPNANLTREQIATFLYRYSEYMDYDLTTTNDLSGFSDGNTVSDFATTAMRWAVDNGYISGFSDHTLRPKESATRAQVATILMRFCQDHEEV